MKSLLVTAACLTLANAAAVTSKVAYDGFKVYRMTVGQDVASVKSVVDKFKLGVWTGPVKANSYVDVVVPPSVLSKFEESTSKIDTEIMHEDLGTSIADETSYEIYAAPDISYFNSYHAIADHTKFLSDLAASFPSNSEVFSAGKSVQGRTLTGIHIWGSGGKGSKPAIVWHGTVHAREWITTMVVEYAAYQLLTGYASQADVKKFVDSYDFYIIPIVNPDGFAYTQTNDRLWRKNRQTINGNSCVGRDVNRNWPYQWAQSAGASTNPCDETFKGASAGDAPENVALRNQIDALARTNGVKLYIDFHSYSQLFMTPYGFSCSKLPTNNAAYQSLAQGTARTIQGINGVTFDTGPICSTIYQVSGGSVDYVADVTKAQWSFTFELRDTGRYGFVLPANQILPSGKEIWAGLKYLMTNF